MALDARAELFPKNYGQSLEVQEFLNQPSSERYLRIPNEYRPYALAEMMIHPQETSAEEEVLKLYLYNQAPSDKTRIYTAAFKVAILTSEREWSYLFFDKAVAVDASNGKKLICMGFSEFANSGSGKKIDQKQFEDNLEGIYTLASISYNVPGLAKESCDIKAKYDSYEPAARLRIEELVRIASSEVANQFAFARKKMTPVKVNAVVFKSKCSAQQIEFYLWSSMKTFTDSKKPQLALLAIQENECRLQGELKKQNGEFKFEMKIPESGSSKIFKFSNLKEAVDLIMVDL